MSHTVKGFGIVKKVEIDVFLELSCFFNDPADVGNLTSGSSAFYKTSLNIWKFTVHVLLKPGLENFEHYFTSMWDEWNCVVVWAFFGIAFPPSIFPSTKVFSNESVLHIRWPKYWSFSFSISPYNEYSGLISFRIDWLDLLAVQGTLRSLLQQHSSKGSVLWCSAFFTVQLTWPLEKP